MESSGLLDAWVNPEGTILNCEMRFDTFLLDDGQKAGFPGRPTLADVLRRSADRPGGAARVPAEAIERIGRGIGRGEIGGSVWVDFDGRWQIGRKTGRWTKPVAEHIGVGARGAAWI